MKVVRKWWESKNLNSVLNAFTMMKDQTVVVDVLKYTFAEGYALEELSLDNFIVLLSHSRSLLELSLQDHVMIGLKTVQNIAVIYKKKMMEADFEREKQD